MEPTGPDLVAASQRDVAVETWGAANQRDFTVETWGGLYGRDKLLGSGWRLVWVVGEQRDGVP
jgi:hypothetical protein